MYYIICQKILKSITNIKNQIKNVRRNDVLLLLVKKKYVKKTISKRRKSKSRKIGGTQTRDVITIEDNEKFIDDIDDLRENAIYKIKLGELYSNCDETDDIDGKFYKYIREEELTFRDSSNMEDDNEYDFDEWPLLYFQNVKTNEMVCVSPDMGNANNTFILYVTNKNNNCKPIDPVAEGYDPTNIDEASYISCEIIDATSSDLYNVSMVSKLDKRNNKVTLPSDVQRLTQTFLLPQTTKLK